ncbi:MULTISPECIES: LON peptidase substrate-binding domain-containing protein [unclassified Microbacterium]|uniref:LON peptidase substrate-binding domain-containing protein n=1 Tax=unclassified Microbacterium TaxID=2609290 RepID=UPI0027D44CBB|nr:LON peptidase substrate-binding domain-containing protein [Microbacterium sp. zg.B185]
MANVAMFPLGTVLFPHTPLALRIFEERYLMMLGRLLDDEDPQFGVVLIERGSETGGGEQRVRVGTMARITNVMAGESDIHLIAVGGSRVEVDEWRDDQPYPTASVRELPPLVWDDALTPLHTEAERIVRRVLARAAEFAEVQWDPSVELSDDPLESSWQLAAIAPLGQLDQFRLLRSTTVGGLLRELIDLTLAAEPLLTAPPRGDDFDAALIDLLDKAQAEEEAPDDGPSAVPQDDDDPDAASEDGTPPGP